MVWRQNTNYKSSKLKKKFFFSVQTPWFNWIGHRVGQKYSALPSGVIILKQEPLEIIQLFPFYGPKDFMTCPRSHSLVAEQGLEPGSLDS